LAEAAGRYHGGETVRQICHLSPCNHWTSENPVPQFAPQRDGACPGTCRKHGQPRGGRFLPRAGAWSGLHAHAAPRRRGPAGGRRHRSGRGRCRVAPVCAIFCHFSGSRGAAPPEPASCPVAASAPSRLGDIGARLARLSGRPVACLRRPHLGLSSASRVAAIALAPSTRLLPAKAQANGPAHLRTRQNAHPVRTPIFRPTLAKRRASGRTHAQGGLPAALCQAVAGRARAATS
jgi:hypothetical protein